MSESNEGMPDPENPGDFLKGMFERVILERRNTAKTIEKMTTPSVTAKIPLSIVCRMVDQVVCECDMCIGVYTWAKSLDTTGIDDELKAILRLSIAAAESRLINDQLTTEYHKTFNHKK